LDHNQAVLCEIEKGNRFWQLQMLCCWMWWTCCIPAAVQVRPKSFLGYKD